MKGIGLVLLMFCSIDNAKLVELNDYSLNTDTHIVTTPTGIEWLQFSQTEGVSINQALAANPGWSLASNEYTFEL